jgi:hypothetical protein
MLKFHARGASMCPRFDAPAIRAFIGRKFVAPNAWPKIRDPFAIDEAAPAAAECLLAVSRGDLLPADKSTADACGVKFDPTFGGDAELGPIPSTTKTKD